MAEILNFDEVTCGFVDIQKTPAGSATPRRFHLRDDVPAEAMLPTFSMNEKLRRFREASQYAADNAGDAAAVAQAEQTWEAYDRALAHLCGEIVRHSLPEVTDDELRNLFTAKEREQIVGLFFSRRMRASLPPPPATESSSSPTPTVMTPTAATPMDMPAARRRRRRHAR